MSSHSLIHRCVYRAELADDQIDLQSAKEDANWLKNPGGALLTTSLFQWRRTLFLYVESAGSPLAPETLRGKGLPSLKSWPGEPGQGRVWVPMMDIFHYSTPQNLDHWRRKTPVERPFGRVIRLRPEKVSSYIFYHYQLQEERPGRGDKYGVITLHEDLLFFYQEHPRVSEESPAQPSLKTSNTPENWGELMSQHFAPWPDAGEPEWRPVALIHSVGLPEK
ncbi:MAG: hypothetical protein O3B73_02660 [bacterium]|nr:hypothetical protein [bacterium]